MSLNFYWVLRPQWQVTANLHSTDETLHQKLQCQTQHLIAGGIGFFMHTCTRWMPALGCFSWVGAAGIGGRGLRIWGGTIEHLGLPSRKSECQKTKRKHSDASYQMSCYLNNNASLLAPISPRHCCQCLHGRVNGWVQTCHVKCFEWSKMIREVPHKYSAFSPNTTKTH